MPNKQSAAALRPQAQLMVSTADYWRFPRRSTPDSRMARQLSPSTLPSFENNVILIRSGMKNGKFWQPKTKHGNRRIAIVPELAELLRHVMQANRKNNWVFETKRVTRLHPCNVQKRFREICDGLGFEKRFTVHSLRKYWASTVAQQGMPWQVMIKMFGHGDFKLILKTYYAQNDDARLVDEASKIDFGLNDPSKRPGSEG